MPPTINGTTEVTAAENSRPQATQQTAAATQRRSDLICRVKYTNTLPDIPFDLKFLQYPFDGNRFVQYNPTSLERNYKYEVLTEHDLGVTIDLINRDLYTPDSNAQLAPADEKLLEDDVHTPQDSLRSKQHSRSVSWLRKSEYISTEQTRFQPQNLENIEAKVGYNVKKTLREETLYLDRDAQVKAIEKTFEDSKQEITKHYSKANVVPVEVYPIYPDFKSWKYPCAQVIFDNDPAPVGKNVPAQIEEMSQAMIRGVMDESGEQFVAYFLPTDETLEKRRRDLAEGVIYKDDETYEYKIAREYNWNVKSKASKGYEENYFFVLRNDGVYYNELETRVRLNKRRIKIGQQPSNTKLIVRHRPLDATEDRMQRYREKQLETAGEDDEEEEMDIDEDDDEEVQSETRTITAKDKIAETETNKTDDKEKIAEKVLSTDNDAAAKARDRELRSRSKSGSRSRSRSRSRVSKSKSRSRSKSLSKAKSKSRSKSKSKSRSRSKSNSKSKSRSRSRSASGSSSASGSRSRSVTPSGGSRSGSASRSPSRSRSRSRSVSRSVSKSRSRSVSKSRSRSGSKSPSKSPSNGSRSRSHSRSASGSRSGSARSASRSPSRSGSGSGSGSDSETGSGSGGEE